MKDPVNFTYPLTHSNGVECGTDEETKNEYGFHTVFTEEFEGVKERTIIGEREAVKAFCEDYAFDCLVDLDSGERYYSIPHEE
jgi:hypothetical protein